MQIQKVAVLGTSNEITTCIADSGVQVLVIDLIPEDLGGLARSMLHNLKQEEVPFVSDEVKTVITKNLESNLIKLKDVDLILENVIDDFETKCFLYNKIEPYLKDNAIIISDTLTTLKMLASKVGSKVAKNLMIAHFLKPICYTHSVELVTSHDNSIDSVDAVKQFLETKAGRTVVKSPDIPGLIADRIGLFWLCCGLSEAIKFKINIENADKIMTQMGTPKTGIFGLIDLIGVDIFALNIQALIKELPKNDQTHTFVRGLDIILNMIANDDIGTYRNCEQSRKNSNIDLLADLYQSIETHDVDVKSIKNLFESDDIHGKFAWSVWSQTLSYTASLIPEISDHITLVDEAIKLGYNWKHGPFELIDKLNKKDNTWLTSKLQKDGISVPKLLQFGKTMYNKKQSLTATGEYKDIKINLDSWYLSDFKREAKPIITNIAASLWDVGDGVACFEFNSKDNAINYQTLKLLYDAINIVPKYFNCLVIGNDSVNFSAGINQDSLRDNFKSKEDINYGQSVLQMLKFSYFPVVAAVSGFILGAGCEVALHCDAIQAYTKTYARLTEKSASILSGLGGYKEMILRYLECSDNLEKFIDILGNTAKSAKQMYDLHILRDNDQISINRKRLLADAKTKALKLLPEYHPPKEKNVQLSKVKLCFQNLSNKSFAKATFHNQDLISEKDILDLEKEISLELSETS